MVQIAGAFVGCGGGLLLTTVRLYNNAMVVVGGVQAAANVYNTGQVTLGDGLALAAFLGWAGNSSFPGGGCFGPETLFWPDEDLRAAVGVADVSASAGVMTENIRERRAVWSVVAVGIGVAGWYAANVRKSREEEEEDEDQKRRQTVAALFGRDDNGLLGDDDENEPLRQSWSPGFSRISEDEEEELAGVLAGMNWPT